MKKHPPIQLTPIKKSDESRTDENIKTRKNNKKKRKEPTSFKG